MDLELPIGIIKIAKDRNRKDSLVVGNVLKNNVDHKIRSYSKLPRARINASHHEIGVQKRGFVLVCGSIDDDDSPSLRYEAAPVLCGSFCYRYSI